VGWQRVAVEMLEQGKQQCGGAAGIPAVGVLAPRGRRQKTGVTQRGAHGQALALLLRLLPLGPLAGLPLGLFAALPLGLSCTASARRA
jgi:hypothetical protein